MPIYKIFYNTNNYTGIASGNFVLVDKDLRKLTIVGNGRKMKFVYKEGADIETWTRSLFINTDADGSEIGLTPWEDTK